jgi:hypothetical protein
MEMEDNISFIETDQIEEKVQVILRQTDYSRETILNKLREYNYDHIKVIKSYFGITEKKAPEVKSINQEIFRQLRTKLDANMRDYHSRVEKGEVKKVI